MFQKTGTKFKVEEFVEITLTGQDPFEAVVFLSVGDRLIDLLNDTRSFIPVKRMDNSTIIMSKSNIVSIIEKDPFADAQPEEEEASSQDLTPHYDEEDFNDEATAQSGAQAEQNTSDTDAGQEQAQQDGQQKQRTRKRRKRPQEFDAYAILKVSPSASIEEIRKAYKSRIKAVHPDAVAGLDLDEDLVRAAIATTQRVNYAYHRILKERKASAEAETAAGATEDAAA